ncbi:hypothetical protein [Xanthocytophaga flava]|uniref:hypothetical protein n=1 Tax=Xanthocytophaga flava TaxID=3048013 RepID=UPI0028D86CFD|nr:hypothetical protein [Xanthocytophaga flavus]MDJ1473471.1 hypothetical protein [Xanthocytophaga flavus]
MQQIIEFRINPELYPSVKKRFKRRGNQKIYYFPGFLLLIWLIISVIRFGDLIPFFYGVVFCLPFTLLTFVTNRQIKKELITYRFIVNDKGIEHIGAGVNFKFIEWVDMDYFEKEEEIWVIDTSVSSFIRWFTWNGVIIIPNEIEDREALLQILDAKKVEYGSKQLVK